MRQNVACVECRQIFEAEETSCPSCNATTFVYLDVNDDVNALCDELLAVAAFARMDHEPPAEVFPARGRSYVRKQMAAPVATGQRQNIDRGARK